MEECAGKLGSAGCSLDLLCVVIIRTCQTEDSGLSLWADCCFLLMYSLTRDVRSQYIQSVYTEASYT